MREIPFQRLDIIVNPIAGSGRALHTGQELAESLRALGVQVELHATRQRGDACRYLQLQEQRAQAVIAIGGDGTVREVLEGLQDRPVPVLVLPQGTANVLGLDLSLPRHASGALRTLHEHRSIEIDLARVHTQPSAAANQDPSESRLSFLVSGVGFDAAIVHALEQRRKGPIHKGNWLAAGWSVFRSWQAPQLEVEIDDQRIAGNFGWVLFSNVVHYAGLRVMAPDRRLDDGQFEVYLFEKCSRLGLLVHQWNALTRGWPAGACQRRLARRLVVRSTQPVACQVDGDAAGFTPFAAEVLAERRTLLVPC